MSIDGDRARLAVEQAKVLLLTEACKTLASALTWRTGRPQLVDEVLSQVLWNNGSHLSDDEIPEADYVAIRQAALAEASTLLGEALRDAQCTALADAAE